MVRPNPTIEDVPPPPPPIPYQNYGDATYWNERYAREPVCFDWYQGWSGLEAVITRHMRPEEPLLHIGMGTSKLQEAMVKEGGWQRIVNVDVSSVVVEQMKQRHVGLEQLEYRVGDVRSLPEFADGTFGAALDKGTLDAILCGAAAVANATAALTECCRLLKPGGCFMLVTYGDPSSRLPHLTQPQLAWDVQVYVLSKPSTDAAGAAAAAAGRGGESGRVVVQGPFDSSSEADMSAVAALRDVHFVYACTKRGHGATAAAAAVSAGDSASEESRAAARALAAAAEVVAAATPAASSDRS